MVCFRGGRFSRFGLFSGNDGRFLWFAYFDCLVLLWLLLYIVGCMFGGLGC